MRSSPRFSSHSRASPRYERHQQATPTRYRDRQVEDDYFRASGRGGSALNEEEKMMIEKDFDFEANLAMFDKDREMQEIEAELTNKPDIVRLVHSNVRQPEPKYRNDENILGSKLSLSLSYIFIVDCLGRNLSARVPSDRDGGGGGGRQVLRDGLRPGGAQHQPPAAGETAGQRGEPRHRPRAPGGDDGPGRH